MRTNLIPTSMPSTRKHSTPTRLHVSSIEGRKHRWGTVTRIVVTGDQDDAFGLLGIFSAQYCVDIGDDGGLGDAWVRPCLRRLGKGIALDLKAASTIAGVTLQPFRDPVGGSAHTLARRQVFVHAGKRAAVFEAG